jgi:hypothetical protein
VTNFKADVFEDTDLLEGIAKSALALPPLLRATLADLLIASLGQVQSIRKKLRLPGLKKQSVVIRILMMEK